MGFDKKKSGAARRGSRAGDHALNSQPAKPDRGTRGPRSAGGARGDGRGFSRLRELRERAEALLETRGDDIPDLSPSEARRLLHELRSAQLELELQNEELRSAHNESEGLYRLLAENATDVVCLADLDFECSYVSPSVEQLLGYTVDEIMAMSIADVVTPASLAQLRGVSEHERLLEEQGTQAAKQSLVMELEMIRKNGAVVSVESTVTITRDAEGRFAHIVGVTRNIEDRKRAEKVLRASERRLRVALDAVSDGVWEYEVPSGVVHASQRCLDLLGYPLHEMSDTIGFWRDLLHPGDLALLRSRFEEHAAGKAPRFEAEFRLRDSEGRWLWILGKGQVSAWDKDLKPTRILGTLTEIGGRKEAEAHARLLSSVVEQCSVSMAIADFQGCLTFANCACCALFGYAPEEILGKHLSMLHRPEDLPIIEAANERLRETGRFVGVIPCRRRDGSVFPCMMRNVMLKDENGNPAALVGTFDDVAERVELEERLREGEARLKQAMEGAELGIWEREIPSGRLMVNDRWAEILGHTPDEIAPHMSSWRDRIHPEDRARTLAAMDDHLEGRAPFYEGEFRMRTKTGGWRWILSRGRVVERDEEGRPLRTAGTHLDISARKEAEKRRQDLEAQMQKTQKLESLGVLAGGIAHDFNNILMAIMGNTDLILRDIAKDSPLRPRLEEVEKAARRAVTLTRQMLAYSGKGRIVARPVDLGQTASEIAHLLRSSFPENVLITLNLGENLPPIMADSAQIQQVVMNLLLNASEAFGDDPQGDIVVATGVREFDRADLSRTYLDEGLPEGPYVYLEVTDTGCGMSEEVLNRIFDPFYSTKFTGRGLGLAALLGIVRGHNGAVMADSRPGSGSTFTVLFPPLDAAAAEMREQGSAAGEADWRGTGTVLLVDDEEAVREVSSRMLERIGLKVITAADGLEALEVFKRYSGGIDCVLLDLTMPRMGGEQAYHALRALDKKVPIVLSSGFGEQELAERFAERDIVGIIEKPYRTGALTALMRGILEK